MQALPYVALLIVMLFFIYAVIGMQVSIAVVTSLSHQNLAVVSCAVHKHVYRINPCFHLRTVIIILFNETDYSGLDQLFPLIFEAARRTEGVCRKICKN